MAKSKSALRPWVNKMDAARVTEQVARDSYGHELTWFYGQWLPQSGYEPAHFPAFEEYFMSSKMRYRMSCRFEFIAN